MNRMICVAVFCGLSMVMAPVSRAGDNQAQIHSANVSAYVPADPHTDYRGYDFLSYGKQPVSYQRRRNGGSFRRPRRVALQAFIGRNALHGDFGDLGEAYGSLVFGRDDLREVGGELPVTHRSGLGPRPGRDSASASASRRGHPGFLPGFWRRPCSAKWRPGRHGPVGDAPWPGKTSRRRARSWREAHPSSPSGQRVVSAP